MKTVVNIVNRNIIRLSMFLILVALAGTLVTARSDSVPLKSAYVPGEVLVKFREGTDEWTRNWVRGRVNALAVRRYRHVGIEKVLIGPGCDVDRAIQILDSDPRVEFAEPNWKVEFDAMPREIPDDPGFTSGEQWYLDSPPYDDLFLPPGMTIPTDVDIDAPEAWGLMAFIFDSTVTTAVGVLDWGCGQSGYFSDSTGYIPGHMDLPNEVLFANTAELSLIGSDSPADPNNLVDDVNGWDWVDDDNVPADPPTDPLSRKPFHGTRISGIIAARWNNDEGVAGIGKGHLKVLPLRIENIGDIVAGMEYAIEMTQAGKSARVLNASWHIRNNSLSLMEAVEQAGEAGMALAAAAGNRGHDNDDEILQVYPAEYTKVPLTNVLAVGATGMDGALTDFSNYGVESVQIAAPGESLYSTGGGTQEYAWSTGTSFSAPVAAAALGLVFAANPDLAPEEAIARVVDGGYFDPRLAGQIQSGKRVNLAGALAPFHPYSGLAPIDGSMKPTFLYTDSISASYGSIYQAVSSDDSVAVMVADPSGAWIVSPASPGVASFTLFFDGDEAPLDSYETGPWRVTAISPFSATVRAGEISREPFTSLLPGNVSWSVMDPSLGTIDEEGWFTARLPGWTRVVLSIDGIPVDSSGAIRILPPYSEDDDGDGGCFIATAAFGSPLEPHVRTLREFRDRYLMTNRAGRVFVSFYYRHSPPMADIIASNVSLRFLARAVLVPVVAACWSVLHLGLFPTIVALLLLIAIPARAWRRKCQPGL